MREFARELVLMLRYGVLGWLVGMIIAVFLFEMGSLAGIHFGRWGAAAMGYIFGMAGYIAGQIYGVLRE